MNNTDFTLAYGRGDSIQVWEYSCSRRSELISDYLKITDLYLSTSPDAGKDARSYPSFPVTIRLNHQESNKYIKASLTAYRSFMRMKRESITDEAEDEAGSLR